jgi:minimal PKS acyl carrier protein
MHELTLDELRRIMLEAAGADEGIDLDGDILDVPFADLGYDSLAMLETSARIEREIGVELSEDSLFESADTPRALMDMVNAMLSNTAAA